MIKINQGFDIDVINLCNSLTELSSCHYEELRKNLIEKHSVNTFRDIQRVSFCLLHAKNLGEAFKTAKQLYKD